MDLSKYTDDRVVSEWPLLQGEAGEGLDLDVAQGDWTRGNEIRAEIYLPSNPDDQIRCDLELDTITDGFDENDGYWFNAIVSPRGGNIWEGWQEFRMPFPESFYARGIPEGL